MFRGKTAIITGGSSGLGKELAKRLIGKGADLALVARDRDKLESAIEEIAPANSLDRRIETYSCDVRDAASVEQAAKAICDRQGPPDILINSAGILREGYFETVPTDTFEEVMDTNFYGSLYWIQSVLPHFKAKGDGCIVNISSMSGILGVFGYAAYCASKHALNGLTSSLRLELAPQNIRLHLVCPPEFGSPMVDELNTYRTKENRVLAQTLPVMTVEKVADDTIRGMERGTYLIVPGTYTRMFERLNRFLPSLTRMVSDRVIRQNYKGVSGRG